MKLAPGLGLGFVFALGFSAPARADLIINDSGGAITHDCSTDPEIIVNASETSLTLTGACTKVLFNGSEVTATIESVGKLAINGGENTVAIDAVDKIIVTGADNKVTYKRPVAAKKTKVSKLGTGNSIKKVK